MNISDDEADDLPLSERFKNIKSVRGSIDSSSDEGEEDAEGSEDSEEGQDIKGSSDEDEDSEDDIPLGDRFGRNASGSKRKKGPKPGAVVVKRAKNDSSAEKKLLKDVEVHRPQLYQQKEVIEPLKPRIENLKWWEMDLSKDVKWTSLEHNGVMFPPEYEPHGIPILYDGKPVKLTPEQEEVATFYAVKLETDYVQNPKFRQNFFRDWKVLLGPNHVIKKLELCDFSDILDWHKREREKLKELRKDPEYKAKQKLEKERIQKLYGFALVDGVLQRVGNFRIEPPGLFLGRGDHPKIGTLKTRVKPEDIIINIGPNTKIPRCPIPGHDWGGVVHSNQVTWLAYWKENVNESFKYVYLHSSSHFKGISDFEKYEKARKLKLFIKKIRDGYMKDMESADPLVCQRATAIWIIDVLALRAGNEKDTEDEADTVGCCSLRVEHLKFEEPKSVIFDFLGKDSMRYFNKVKVIPPVYKNLKRFCAKKSPTDQIFDRLTVSFLSLHLLFVYI